MLHCLSHYFSLTSYKKKIFIAAAGRKVIVLIIRSFPCSLETTCRYYLPCVCVKRKFQFVTAGNCKSSKRHAILYSIVFGSL